MAESKLAAPAPTTQGTSTLPSHVATLTIIAQVVGYLIATFGGLLTVYQTTHGDQSWPGALITVVALIFNACIHYGYVKGQALTQNAIVDTLLRQGGPAAAAFIAVMMNKGTVSAALDAAMKAAFGVSDPNVTPVVGLPASLVPPSIPPVVQPASVTVPPPTGPR